MKTPAVWREVNAARSEKGSTCVLICNIDEMTGEEHRLKTALELHILDGCADDRASLQPTA